jgi:hypothetical protein
MKKPTVRLIICLSFVAFVATYLGLGPALYWNAHLDEPTEAEVTVFVQSRLNDPNHARDHDLSLDPDGVFTVTSASNLSVTRVSWSNLRLEDEDPDIERFLFSDISADLSLSNLQGETRTHTVRDHVIQIHWTGFEPTSIVFSPSPDALSSARWKVVPQIEFDPLLLLIASVVALLVAGMGVLLQKCFAILIASFKAMRHNHE